MTSSWPRKWQFPRDDVPAWGVAAVFVMISISLMVLFMFVGYQVLRSISIDGWEPYYMVILSLALIASSAGAVMAARQAVARSSQRKEDNGFDE